MTTATLEGPRAGETFISGRDLARLNRQAKRVFMVMKDQRWRTLGDIAELIGEPESSISARLRDLRKQRFGGFIVEREYVRRGVWRYRVLPPEVTA